MIILIGTRKNITTIQKGQNKMDEKQSEPANREPANREPKSVYYYANFFAELNKMKDESLRDAVRLTPTHMQVVLQMLEDYQQLEQAVMALSPAT
jgi:hypothetical protein